MISPVPTCQHTNALNSARRGAAWQPLAPAVTFETGGEHDAHVPPTGYCTGDPLCGRTESGRKLIHPASLLSPPAHRQLFLDRLHSGLAGDTLQPPGETTGSSPAPLADSAGGTSLHRGAVGFPPLS